MAATESLMEGGQASYEKNGEKVNFELQPKNIGLTKEQLEAYRNDPFWKPVRTVLFAIFWLSWIAMFVAAIAIVVLSPKCAEKEQIAWWQNQVSYQLLTPSFRDSNGDGIGDFNGVSEKLDLLRKVGVTTVHITPALGIEGGLENISRDKDFEKLIQTVHDRDMKIVVDLPFGYVSSKHEWFVSGLTDYFITAKAGSPNYNQKDYYEFPGTNDTKYLGIPDKDHPILNWDYPSVINASIDSIKKFIYLDVDGLNFDKVHLYGLGSSDTRGINKMKMLAGIIRDSTDTKNMRRLKEIIASSSLEGLTYKADEVTANNIQYVMDTSFTKLTNTSCNGETARCVLEALNNAMEKFGSNNPSWQFDNVDSKRLASRFDSETANLLTMLQLSLPGAISVYYGQGIGMKDTKTSGQLSVMKWNAEKNNGFSSSEKLQDGVDISESDSDYDTFYGIENSPLKVLQKLAKLRQREEIISRGEMRVEKIDNVIGLSRFANKNETAIGSVFLGVYNFGNKPASVKPNSFVKVLPSKTYAGGEVSVVTSGVTGLRARQKIEFTDSIDLPPRQGAFIKF